MEPVPDVNPPPLVYERYMVDVQEPTENSLNSFRNWCQQTLKYISDKVQGLDTRFANWAQIKADQIKDLSDKVQRLEDSKKTIKHVVNQNAVSQSAAHSNLKVRMDDMESVQNSRARNMNIKLMQQERRIEALEKKLEEPVADRTRHRKQSRRHSPA